MEGRADEINGLLGRGCIYGRRFQRRERGGRVFFWEERLGIGAVVWGGRGGWWAAWV